MDHKQQLSSFHQRISGKLTDACLRNYSRSSAGALTALRRGCFARVSVREKSGIFLSGVRVLLSPLQCVRLCGTVGLLQRFPGRKRELRADTPPPLLTNPRILPWTHHHPKKKK
ncbi:uncharacterized protein V6R79_008892 [Siganus canaliculatus]